MPGYKGDGWGGPAGKPYRGGDAGGHEKGDGGGGPSGGNKGRC
jgi:hypothetical protein